MAAKQYRQISGKLRIQRGPGRPDYVSERPRDPRTQRYTDLEEPTLVSFDQHCQVDVEKMIRRHQIAELEPGTPAPAAKASAPKAAAKPARKS